MDLLDAMRPVHDAAAALVGAIEAAAPPSALRATAVHYVRDAVDLTAHALERVPDDDGGAA